MVFKILNKETEPHHTEPDAAQSLEHFKVSIDDFSDQVNRYDRLSTASKAIVDQFYDEVSSIEDLNEIDKIILIANFLQSRTQFYSGPKTQANNQTYEYAHDVNRETFADPDTAIVNQYGCCTAISGAFCAIADKFGLTVERVIVPGHSYCSFNYEGKKYMLDPTWGCSRNEHHIEGVPKATQFSDQYIMVPLADLAHTQHHTVPAMRLDDPQLATAQLDRQIIQDSITKLKNHGIAFDYPEEVILPVKQ